MAGGTLNDAAFGDIQIEGVGKDTRTLQKNNLYIPLIRRKNGHHYVEEAFRLGAAASLWQRDQPNPPRGVPLLYVEDTLLALQKLAANYRKELTTFVVGVTGSNGKTTTREMIASVLGTRYSVHRTSGNLNNHYGLPLTILEIAGDTDAAVLEMGMSSRGEIEVLSRIAQPDIAVITMIGDAHIEHLGSREEIAKAKMEIVSGLSPSGTLVYHGDEPLLHTLLVEHLLATKTENTHTIGFKTDLELTGVYADRITCIPFGTSGSNLIRLKEVYLDLQETHFTAHIESGLLACTIPMAGEHYAQNALAAIAVGKKMEIPDELIRQGLRQTANSAMRMEVLRCQNGATLINDAFNASPASMKAAIHVLHRLEGFSRKWAVLGDMLELGEHAENYHREIGMLLRPDKLDYIYTYGPLGAFIAEEAAKTFGLHKVRHFSAKPDLLVEIRKNLQPGDLALFKASRGTGLEEVAEAML